MNFAAVKSYLMGLQARICGSLAFEDGEKEFAEDDWSREAGGGGRTRVLRNGSLFEQAGVKLFRHHAHFRSENPPAVLDQFHLVRSQRTDG